MSRETYGVVMDDDETADFLEAQGIGTLSMGDETGGYGIPMSFGYDRVEDRCILQLSFGEDSLKDRFIKEENTVTLSTYDWNSITDWRSVVIRGSLEELPPEDSGPAGGVFAAFSKIASPEVFRQPLGELDFRWYVLTIEDVHGRRAAE